MLEWTMPRRGDYLRLIPAEKAIIEAMHAVELVGAAIELTDVVITLSAALNLLADYVDAHPST